MYMKMKKTEFTRRTIIQSLFFFTSNKIVRVKQAFFRVQNIYERRHLRQSTEALSQLLINVVDLSQSHE